MYRAGRADLRSRGPGPGGGHVRLNFATSREIPSGGGGADELGRAGGSPAADRDYHRATASGPRAVAVPADRISMGRAPRSGAHPAWIPGGVVHANARVDLRRAAGSAYTTALAAWWTHHTAGAQRVHLLGQDAKQPSPERAEVRRREGTSRRRRRPVLLAGLQAPRAHREVAGRFSEAEFDVLASVIARTYTFRRG